MKVNVRYAGISDAGNTTFEILDGGFADMVNDLIDQWENFRHESYKSDIPADWLCDARITSVEGFNNV